MQKNCPGAVTQGRTIEQGQKNLIEAAELVLQANRELSEKELAGSGLSGIEAPCSDTLSLRPNFRAAQFKCKPYFWSLRANPPQQFVAVTHQRLASVYTSYPFTGKIIHQQLGHRLFLPFGKRRQARAQQGRLGCS